jgi:hypothetical protein
MFRISLIRSTLFLPPPFLGPYSAQGCIYQHINRSVLYGLSVNQMVFAQRFRTIARKSTARMSPASLCPSGHSTVCTRGIDYQVIPTDPHPDHAQQLLKTTVECL